MSKNESIDILAGEYVLGSLQGDERRLFDARMRTDASAARAVADWEERLSPLAEPAETVEPSPAVWDAIKRRIALEPKRDKAVTIRADEGEWLEHSPGVAFKLLKLDAEAGLQSYLLRLDPGAEIEAHDHHADEECLMLSGEVTFGDHLTLRAGDYHMVPKGAWHARAHSTEGCLAFIRGHV